LAKLARSRIQCPHDVPCIGEHQPRLVRSLAVSPPPGRQHRFSRLGSCGQCPHSLLPFVGIQCLFRASCCELPRGRLLPVLSLPSHFIELDDARLCRNAAKRSTRFDRLQLLWVSDQNNLRTSLLDGLEHSLELSCPYQPRLVDHQDVTRCELIATLRPAHLPAR